MSQDETYSLNLRYNDLLAISKLVEIYRHPARVPYYGADWRAGLSDAVDQLAAKLDDGEVTRWMLEHQPVNEK